MYLRAVLAGNGGTSLLAAGDWDNWTLDTRQHRSGGIITHRHDAMTHEGQSTGQAVHIVQAL